MMLELRQKGVENLINKAKNMDSDIRKIIDGTLDDARSRCNVYAMGYVPKDTGRLAESIYSYRIKNGFVIGADSNIAPYAIFNEYGSITTPIGDVSSPMAAKKTGVRPFLRPAIYNTIAEMDEMFGLKLKML